MDSFPQPDTSEKPPKGLVWLLRALRSWLDYRDRGEIFTEAATAATNASPAFWIIVIVSAAIAALGLALDSASVVIGAMLVAPLLAPIVGLAMALAIGDGALAVETALIVLASTVVVILTSAALTAVLPVTFQTITAEISSRTRPTTVDLFIAAFSGLAGATVTVARKSRLGAAIPGVAIAVALVPPLAATGYGIGTGWNWQIIKGSLLLYSANLTGIVMSAMLVFLFVGMHRPEILELAARWAEETRDVSLSRAIRRTPGLRRLGMMSSVWARIGLVAGFVALVAIPLSSSLKVIARETRIKRAVNSAAAQFSQPGRSFIISRNVNVLPSRASVVLNVATTRWFADSARTAFEQRASEEAGEHVTLVLEQIPASSGDLTQLAQLVTPTEKSGVTGMASVSPARQINALREQASGVMQSVSLPDSVRIVGFDFTIAGSSETPVLNFAYLSGDSLTDQARQMILKEIQSSLGLEAVDLRPAHVAAAERIVTGTTGPAVDSIVELLNRYPSLQPELISGPRTPAALATGLRSLLPRVRDVEDTLNILNGRRAAAIRLRIR